MNYQSVEIVFRNLSYTETITCLNVLVKENFLVLERAYNSQTGSFSNRMIPSDVIQDIEIKALTPTVNKAMNEAWETFSKQMMG